MQPWGEIQYAAEVPGRAGGPIEESPFTGNFSADDFTYWPIQKKYDGLEFEPPGFVHSMLTREVLEDMIDFTRMFGRLQGLLVGRRSICFML